MALRSWRFESSLGHHPYRATIPKQSHFPFLRVTKSDRSSGQRATPASNCTLVQLSPQPFPCYLLFSPKCRILVSGILAGVFHLSEHGGTRALPHALLQPNAPLFCGLTMCNVLCIALARGLSAFLRFCQRANFPRAALQSAFLVNRHLAVQLLSPVRQQHSHLQVP